MLKGLFPRLFGSFREGGIVHAKFVVTNSGTPSYALKSAVGSANYQGLALTHDSGTGKIKLTLSGGCRQMALLKFDYVNIANPTDFTKALQLSLTAAHVESTGVVQGTMFQTGTTTSSPAAAAPVTNDEIHFTLYVSK